MTTASPPPVAADSPARPAVSPWKAAFSSRGFVAAVAVLALAAVGMNAVTEALQLHYKKQPVPLRAALSDDEHGLPREMGGWVSVLQQNTLDEDIQHSLGTKEFVFRTYVDSRAVGREAVEQLQKLRSEIETMTAGLASLDKEATKQQNRRLAAKQVEWGSVMRRIQDEHPEAVMALNVTYYTGMVDTVAHIPDRCMVADGYEPRNAKTIDLSPGTLPDGTPRQLKAQFATFEDQTGHGRVSRNIAYFFHCNGGYEPSPVGVRGKLQNLFERHAYYAKVELMTDDPARPGAAPPTDAQKAEAEKKSVAAMNDLLSVALPEVERCLPDWNALKGGEKTAVAAR